MTRIREEEEAGRCIPSTRLGSLEGKVEDVTNKKLNIYCTMKTR